MPRLAGRVAWLAAGTRSSAWLHYGSLPPTVKRSVGRSIAVLGMLPDSTPVPGTYQDCNVVCLFDVFTSAVTAATKGVLNGT